MGGLLRWYTRVLSLRTSTEVLETIPEEMWSSDTNCLLAGSDGVVGNLVLDTAVDDIS